jgi:hypothetical protein
MIRIAVVAVLLAGATKTKRYIDLRKRIATCAREEELLLFEYEQASRITGGCGNVRQMARAYFAVAEERRRQIIECEWAIRRLW